MPRILRIVNRLNLGGPTYNVAFLTKYLPPEYETLLLAGQKDETEASSEFILEQMGIKPRYISNMHRAINPLNDLKAFFEIKRIIKDFKPDIVHTHAAKSGALGRIAAYQCGVPVIVHTFHGHVFHSYFHPLKTKFFIQIERALAKISSGIIAISNIQKKELSQEFNIAPEEKFQVIQLGFDLEKFQQNTDEKRQKFRNEFNLDNDEIAVGIIGRLVPVKNHEMFLNVAAQILKQTDKKVRFFIIGDGEERKKIETTASDKQIDFIKEDFKNKKAALTFTSWIKEVDMALAGLDIVTLTSLNEGTPVSLIEAQAANKPIVSTRVGGIEDVVIENKTAFLSGKQEVSLFVSHLLKLIEEDNLRANTGNTGKEHVMKNYTFNRLINDTDLYYKKLLSRVNR
jgi:glycosyltransferase involved in cell wall biosynthesis